MKRYSISHGPTDVDEDPAGAWVEYSPELEAIVADAMRYRWLRADNAYAPEEDLVRGGEDLDKLCDEGIARTTRQEGRKSMSNGKAWDPDAYSTEYSASPLVQFSPADTRGLSIGRDDELQWPVSFEQLQAWGCKPGDECSWLVEGPALCWFTINGVRVAKGTRSAEGAYSWEPQCTCLDDEDSGGNRFKDWDEDCPVHGRATLNTGQSPISRE